MGGFEVHRRNGTDGICFWIACEVVGVEEEERAIQGFTLSSDVNSDAGYTDGKAWKGRFRAGPFWS